MSIRVLAVYVFVAALSIYAWKNWFTSFCGLILMMAVIEHTDMPKTLLGIQGLSLWNILFVMTFLAQLASRRREGLAWDLPRLPTVLLVLYLGAIGVGVLRAAMDPRHLEDYSLLSLISVELIDTIKWALPGLLLFYGCRTRQRLLVAFVCLLAVYFLLAIQVMREAPFEAVLGGGGNQMYQACLRACRRVGYSTGEMSTMLGGAFWGVVAALPLVRQKRYKVMILAATGMLVFGLALTNCRAGYVAWAAAGLVLCLLKWRKYLVLVPMAVVLLPAVFPGAAARMLSGFGEVDAEGRVTVNSNSVTSGRVLIWPHVIDKIGEAPWVGYGRLAMRRTGLTEYLGDAFEEPFPHPHNMYLESLLDNGIVGSLPIFLFWGLALVYAAALFRSDNRLYAAIGGFGVASVFIQLLAGMGAQHFYPLESTVGTWAAIFLVLRIRVEEMKASAGAVDGDTSWRYAAWEPIPNNRAGVYAGDGTTIPSR